MIVDYVHLFSSFHVVVSLFSLGPSLVSLQSTRRSQKRRATTPSPRVKTRFFSQRAEKDRRSAHCRLSVLCSEVRRRLPRPVVRGDGASWQRGAPQRGGVSVRLQGGPGLWRPGDSGLRHEGEEGQKHRTVALKWLLLKFGY